MPAAIWQYLRLPADGTDDSSADEMVPEELQVFVTLAFAHLAIGHPVFVLLVVVWAVLAVGTLIAIELETNSGFEQDRHMAAVSDPQSVTHFKYCWQDEKRQWRVTNTVLAGAC